MILNLQDIWHSARELTGHDTIRMPTEVQQSSLSYWWQWVFRTRPMQHSRGAKYGPNFQLMEIQVRISGSCDHEDDDWTVKYWRKTPNRDFRLPSLEAWLQKYEEYETHNDWIYEERKANRYFDFPRSLLTAGGRGQGVRDGLTQLL